MSERRPSYGAPSHSSSRLPRSEAGGHHPAAHPPPSTQLPPLPAEAYAGNSHASTSTARYSQSTARQPTSPEGYADQQRQRGESSPVMSRHRDTGWSSEGQAQSTRRQSSTATPRRIVDGREETREERRVRKERERAIREQEESDAAASPTDGRRRSSRPNRSSQLPSSPSGADELSNLSLGSPPLANAAARAPPPSTSSKSVLTIALQRAQSAVLLDSANNVPAAISAYTQSVRLLKEVMQRVEEGARREREKEAARGYDRNEPRAGETQDDFERRVVKAEKKERAKQDEARRLRVIHDTYEDRIRMLQTVGEPSTDSAPPDESQAGSSPSTPSTVHAHSPASLSTSTFIVDDIPRAPPLTTRSRSITSLGTVSTPPATFHPVGDAPPPILVVQQPTPARPRDEDSSEGIGNAMLSGSPPASPVDTRIPSASRISPSLSTLPVVGDPYSYGAQRLAPSMVRRPSIADEPIAEDDENPPPFDSRASISSESTATSMSRTMTVAGVADLSTPFRSPYPNTSPSHLSHSHNYFADREASQEPAAIDLTSPAVDEEEEESGIPHSESFKSTKSSVSDGSAPFTAQGQGFGWPSEEDTEEVDDSRASSFVLSGTTSPSSMRRSESSNSMGESMKRVPSGDSMQRTASGDSVMSMRGSSIFGPGGFSQMTAIQAPPPGDYHSPRFSTPIGLGHPPPNDQASRPRPGRSASLANTPTYVATASSSRRGPPSLVSSSTSLGTISQRRRPPQPNGLVEGEDGDKDEEEELDQAESAHTMQDLPRFGDRPASSERTVASEFGLALQSAGGGSSYSSASLPTRLRTQSQGGSGSSRPSLLSHHSDMPPVPSRLGDRSTSSSYTRKGSIPGTSSGLSLLHAPPLGRSNSNSSQGSFSERDSRGESPQFAYAPSHQSTSSFSASYAPSIGSETPTYSTFSSRGVNSLAPTLSSPPPLHATSASQAVSSIRRPFHVMNQLVISLEGEGCYITPRLYVPHQVWVQSSTKMVAIETKVRMLDLLLSGLDSVSKATAAWTERGGPLRTFVNELDSFEGLMDGIQSTLSKKLGYGPSGKKSGATSFSAWSSKLSRSLDRVANGRSLDKPEVYTEVLAKVFKQSHILDWHLGLLTSPEENVYSKMSPTERHRIEQRLKRASDFFGQVILRFVMRDVGMLIDKYIKRSGAWVGE